MSENSCPDTEDKSRSALGPKNYLKVVLIYNNKQIYVIFINV
jgi:hypothetical protein